MMASTQAPSEKKMLTPSLASMTARRRAASALTSNAISGTYTACNY